MYMLGIQLGGPQTKTRATQKFPKTREKPEDPVKDTPHLWQALHLGAMQGLRGEQWAQHTGFRV